MIWLKEITDRKPLSRLFYRYEKAFPEDERREKEDFFALLDRPEVGIFSVMEDPDTEVGYVVVWMLEGFTFLEHLEIYPEHRNGGQGGKVLGWLKERHPGLVLESEPGEQDELAYRRIGFYKRNQFEVINKSYLQPAYRPGGNPVPMWLLSWGEIPSDAQQQILTTVYKKIPPG